MNLTRRTAPLYRRYRTRLPLICLFILAAIKFFLISDREVIAGTADPRTYVESASVNYWNTPYTPNSFIRVPGYPLFLAAVEKTGIPLRLAVEIVFLSASAYLSTSLSRLIKNVWVSPVAFLVAAYQPFAFIIFDHVLTETVVLLCMLFIGGAVTRLLNISQGGKISASVILSCSLAMWSVSRPEAPLNYLMVLAIALVLVLHARIRKGTGSWRDCIPAGIPAGLALAAIVLSSTILKAANYQFLGFYALSEMDQPGYAAIQKALLSIPQPSPRKYVPIPESSRLAAYDISPKFQTLQRMLESETAFGRDFSKEAGISGDIGGGWFYWTLRWAVVTQFQPKTAAELDGHFQEIANEINAGFKSAKAPYRRSWSSIINANYSEWVPRLPESMEEILQCTFQSISTNVSGGDVEADDTFVVSLFDRVANRRTVVTKEASNQVLVNGWAAPEKGNLKAVFAESDSGQILAVATLHGRPDVQRFFLPTQPDLGDRLGFSFEIRSPNSLDPKSWHLSFETDSGNYKSMMPSNNAPGLVRWISQKMPDPIGTIDLWKSTPASVPYLPVWMNFFNQALLITGAAAFLYACWRSYHKDPVAVALLLFFGFVLATTLLRCSLYAVIHAAMWDARQSRYLFPSTPLLYATIAGMVCWAVARALASTEILSRRQI